MTFPRTAEPNTWSGGYVLDVYCDRDNPAHGHREFPHQIVSSSAPKALRVARRAGWVFHRDGTATCPKCSGRMRVAPMPYRTWVHPRLYAAVREAERTGEAPDPATYVGLPRDEQATDQPEHDRGA